MKPVRLGFIGASRIAAKIIPLIREVKGLELAGVAAKDAGRAQAFQKAHALPRAYASYEECLADPEIDAVYISVLNSDHALLIEQSLNAGKHVLCEKPLVLSGTDAERVFGVARKHRRVLLEGFMYRFRPQIEKLMSLLEDDRLGDLKSIHVRFSFLLYELSPQARPLRSTAIAGGGALADVGCYGIDFINRVAHRLAPNSSVKSVRRVVQTDGEIDLSNSVTLEYANGVVATLECAVDRPSLNTWEVCGTKGSIAALRFDTQGSESTSLFVVDEDSVANEIKCPAGRQYESEFENFVAAIHGAAPHILPEESIANAKLMDLIRMSV